MTTLEPSHSDDDIVSRGMLAGGLLVVGPIMVASGLFRERQEHYRELHNSEQRLRRLSRRLELAPSQSGIDSRWSHVSRTLSLAFLAPDIIEMILNGRQPISLTPERLKAARPLPLDWNDQRTALLFD